MQPLVTVLMPVYNAERFLKQAIDSILQQSFCEFELLIINDASTDNSLLIINSYSDPRIRVITNNTNKGISYSLNLGIEQSKTSLIARMDADDISYPERIEKQYRYMIKNPECALLNTWAREITEDGQHIRIEKFKSDHYYYNMTFECWTYHPAVMYRREAVLSAGGYSQPYSEDYNLFCKLLRRHKIYNLDEVLLDYRISQQSLHTVTKEQEYTLAHDQQVMNNIHYFTGTHYQIPFEVFEALKWNFHPLVKKKSIVSVSNFLSQFDFITRKVIEKENPNRNKRDILQAAAHKKKTAITMLSRLLPLPKALQLLVKTGNWKILVFLVTTNIARRFQKKQ